MWFQFVVFQIWRGMPAFVICECSRLRIDFCWLRLINVVVSIHGLPLLPGRHEGEQPLQWYGDFP